MIVFVLFVGTHFRWFCRFFIKARIFFLFMKNKNSITHFYGKVRTHRNLAMARYELLLLPISLDAYILKFNLTLCVIVCRQGSSYTMIFHSFCEEVVDLIEFIVILLTKSHWHISFISFFDYHVIPYHRGNKIRGLYLKKNIFMF